MLSPVSFTTAKISYDFSVTRGNLGSREVRCSLEVAQPQERRGQIQASHPILSLLATAMGCQRLYRAALTQDGGPALPLHSLNFAEITFRAQISQLLVRIATHEEGVRETTESEPRKSFSMDFALWR